MVESGVSLCYLPSSRSYVDLPSYKIKIRTVVFEIKTVTCVMCWYLRTFSVVLDTNKWFHSTLNIGNDISITIGSEYD